MAALSPSRADTSDEEYYDLIDGIIENEEQQEEVDHPLASPSSHESNDGRNVENETEKEDAKKLDSARTSVMDELRVKLEMEQKDEKIEELTEECEKKDGEVKKYSSLLAPFKVLVRRSIAGFDADFYLGISEIFLALLVALITDSVAGYLLAIILNLKGVVNSACAEASKSQHTIIKANLERDFTEPSPTSSDGVALDMEGSRTVTLTVGPNENFGMFDYWGSGSVAFVRSGSAAESQGITRGFEIVSIDGTPLNTFSTAEVVKAYQTVRNNGRATLVVRSNTDRLKALESSMKRFVFIAVLAIINTIVVWYKLCSLS